VSVAVGRAGVKADDEGGTTKALGGTLLRPTVMSAMKWGTNVT
jgi:hypothetical protein